jgi:DNA invertase Pin-like site-specific DNA recombinase
MIAAIYARKSTDQAVADEQKSCTRQIERATEYAVHKGWTVADPYVLVDDGISGAEFLKRPGFLRLMNALKPHPPFQMLIMSEESRLGREAIETAYALKQLITAGVRVFFYLEDRERTLDSPTEKVLLSLTAFADELEREKARQRTTDTMVRKAKSGHVTGGRLFGYDNVEVLGPDGQRSHVERRINDGEASVVRRIFRLCAEGYGLKAITKILNEEGSPSPRAQQGRSQSWAPSSVREALFRSTYRGVIVWNQSRKRNKWGQHHQIARPESDWIQVPAPQLRIVTDGEWHAGHARLDAARAVYMRGTKGQPFGRPALGTPSKYLLTNLAQCGECGHGLLVRSRKGGKGRTLYYACSSYHNRGSAVCSNYTEIPIDDANNVVIESLLDDIVTPDMIEDAVNEAFGLVVGTEPTTDNSRIARLDAVIRRVECERDRLTEAIATGGRLHGLLTSLAQREARLTALRAERETMNGAARQTSMHDPRRVRQELLDLAGTWRQVLAKDPEHARPVVSQLLIGRVTFTPTSTSKCWDLEGKGTLAGLFTRVCPVGMASPSIPSWNQIAGFLDSMRRLRDSAGFAA